jgi:hypothetical protein
MTTGYARNFTASDESYYSYERERSHSSDDIAYPRRETSKESNDNFQFPAREEAAHEKEYRTEAKDGAPSSGEGMEMEFSLKEDLLRVCERVELLCQNRRAGEQTTADLKAYYENLFQEQKKDLSSLRWQISELQQGHEAHLRLLEKVVHLEEVNAELSYLNAEYKKHLGFKPTTDEYLQASYPESDYSHSSSHRTREDSYYEETYDRARESRHEAETSPRMNPQSSAKANGSISKNGMIPSPPNLPSPSPDNGDLESNDAELEGFTVGSYCASLSNSSNRKPRHFQSRSSRSKSDDSTDQGVEKAITSDRNKDDMEKIRRLCRKHGVEERTVDWFLHSENYHCWDKLAAKCAELDRRAGDAGFRVKNPSAWLTKYFNLIRS